MSTAVGSCTGGATHSEGLSSPARLFPSLKTLIAALWSRSRFAPHSQMWRRSASVLRHIRPTYGALNRSTTGVDRDCPDTSLFSFVSDLPDQFSPRSIENGLRQVSLNHSLDIQILKSDQIVFGNQPLRNMMTKVPSRIGGSLVGAAQYFSRYESGSSTAFVSAPVSD